MIVRQDARGDKRLVAYIVRKQDAPVEFEPPALIAALKKSLPEYLVPSAIVALPALPRTPNGKLDRDALPAPDSMKSTDAVLAPRTLLEEKIAVIWSEVLGLEQISMTDNFFDLGGHSLLGLRLVNQLREALGEHLSLGIVFEAPTAARMADLLEKNFPAAVANWIGKTTNADEGAATDRSQGTRNILAVPASGPLAPVIPVNRESRRVPRP